MSDPPTRACGADTGRNATCLPRAPDNGGARDGGRRGTGPGNTLGLASWYGPGFYGNRTACGQVYTPEILGVAHLTLPCGTPLTLTYGGRSSTVPVIDRGPHIAARTLDLSHATKVALGCTDLCTLRMQIRALSVRRLVAHLTADRASVWNLQPERPIRRPDRRRPHASVTKE